MQITNTSEELSFFLKGKTVGFIPTMGALHDGHTSLVKESKRRNLFTVASIFVNPTQFNDPKDFEKYPNDSAGDLKKLESAGCDVVFMPSVDVVYPKDVTDPTGKLDFGLVTTKFEGAFRPGHFKGVAQVVYRFFDIVKPSVSFFGEKDIQQLTVISMLVERLQMDIEIIGMPTVRESDGVAMSSRNLRLTPEERAKADLVFRALAMTRDDIKKKSISQIKDEVQSWFNADAAWNLEYFDVVNADTFETESNASAQNLRVMIAAEIGTVRLIDNLAIS